MKTALITGITGQDGAYLSELLLKKGYRVCGFTRTDMPDTTYGLDYLGITKDVELYPCDLQDGSNVKAQVQALKPDEIYNLAAQSSVSFSFQQPELTLRLNYLSVLNLLESIRKLDKGTRIFQASSSDMYGNITTLPVTLDRPLEPVSPYAVSKAAAHWMIQNYRDVYGVYGCTGVMFNHESYLRGPNFFTKKVIRQSIEIKKGLRDKLIVGNIFPKRDFGYAPAYVDAMWRMLQQDMPDDYMICTGRSIQLKKIVDTVFEILKISCDKLECSTDFYRPEDIDEVYGDPTKAREKLGWEFNVRFEKVLEWLIEEEWKQFSI